MTVNEAAGIEGGAAEVASEANVLNEVAGGLARSFAAQLAIQANNGSGEQAPRVPKLEFADTPDEEASILPIFENGWQLAQFNKKGQDYERATGKPALQMTFIADGEIIADGAHHGLSTTQTRALALLLDKYGKRPIDSSDVRSVARKITDNILDEAQRIRQLTHALEQFQLWGVAAEVTYNKRRGLIARPMIITDQRPRRLSH